MYESMLRCFSFQFELRHKLCCTNFPDKGIVDVNFLLAVSAALVTLMDNNFLYQIVKLTNGELFIRIVLPGHLQEAVYLNDLAFSFIDLFLNICDFRTCIALFFLIVC